MSFLPPAKDNTIQGVGRPDANIMIIGDCPTAAAMKSRVPVAPPIEGVLESCLHQAGLIKGEVFITNYINDDPRLERYWAESKNKAKGHIKVDVSDYREVIDHTIMQLKPKVIVTLGELPAFAMVGTGTLMGKIGVRGYPFIYYLSDCMEIPVIPSLHPNKMIWSNYIWRYYLSHDLQKAKQLAEHPELLHFPKIDTIIPTTFNETVWLLENIAGTCKKVSVDIEVSNFEVSCIGFAVCVNKAFSIPFDMRWTIEEEVTLWNLVAKILGNESITKIGQNFIFDMYFLALRMGIITRGPIIDTMVSHSILYPEFLKSLNFLGSLYTYQAQWKNMVNFKDIKQES